MNPLPVPAKLKHGAAGVFSPRRFIAALLLAANTAWGAEQAVSEQTAGEISAALEAENTQEAGEFIDPGRPVRQVRSREADEIERLPFGVLSGTAFTPMIPGLDHPLTQRYIRQYTSPGGLSWLKQVMTRGEPYLAFIRREIEERGLPPELLYLPVIESAFLPTARSSSGAAGLWQFMKNSIIPFDMKVTEWVDERMDFWKSTQGALSKLEDNFRQLQDWALALAAYNAGLGAVNRIISRTGIKDYWELSDKKYFKTETTHYIPKLLAVAAVVSDPRRYGFEAFWPEDPQWTRVPVDRPADLEILAEAAGIDREILKAANQELYYGVTPPGTGYSLKVRAVDAEALREVLAQTDMPLIRYHFHTIQYGDTLSELAAHYGVSVLQITEANRNLRERYLQIGQRIRIPAVRDVGPYRKAGFTAVEASLFTGTHLVKQGETLWSIALAYNVDPETLAAANGISLEETLRVGRSLKTPIK
ncbi:MAG: LysM peptidoglycan-binding domain-containing protein [Spirochaetaceae bacterium]|nr:LysM peptidoglycan-binding domain-containing protein [Spirochaetaceae bacterium]